jgi:glycosyltransferase involved in cell wall biosynthesis
MTTSQPTRKVLFLAYYFPPLGGGGVQRSLAFARYLPEHGYKPIVVTGPTGDDVERGPRDESLAPRVGNEAEIVRAAGTEPARSTGLRCRAERWLRIEEGFSHWWVEGAVAAARPHAHGADLVYASMSPFETGRAAARIAAIAGKPWVADLRDPWALDDWLVFPTAPHRRLELRTMRRTLATAAAVVMNTPEASRQLLRHAPELADRLVTTIPNGFDPAEFDGPRPQRDEQLFRIVHAGQVHTRPESSATRLGRRVLGGSAHGLDTQTRSHVYLVEAVRLLVQRRPDLHGRIRVELVGTLSSDDIAALPDFVVSHGYLPHAETIELLRSVDLLFMPMHDLGKGQRARIVPGKTYEYLAAQTPILAAVPDGDARDLLEAAGNADVCRPADAEAMSLAIERRVDECHAGIAPPTPEPAFLGRFERRLLTRELADVFDVVLGDAPTTPIPLTKPEVAA